MLRKKFELHLDAVVLMTLLFVASLGMNFVQYRIYADLAQQTNKLELQSLVDSFNLDSLGKEVAQLEGQLESCDTELPAE